MSVTDVTQLMYSAALNNHILEKSQLESVTKILATYTESHYPNIFNKQDFHPYQFSRLMYGMKVYSPDHHENGRQVCQLFITLNNMLVLKNTRTYLNSSSSLGDGDRKGQKDITSTNKGLFNARSFSMCVFGLQNIRPEYPPIREALVDMIKKFREVARYIDDICPLTLSYIIHGTQFQSNSSPELQELMSIVTNMAFHMKPELFTHQLVCNNITGLLKHKYSTSREVLSMLSILTTKFRESDQISTHPIDGNLMGIYFFRLQHMDPKLLNYVEMLEFITTLTDCVKASPSIPSPGQIANMLYLSKAMSSDSPEVSRMFKVIIDKAFQVEGRFSPRDLSKCVSSLRYIDVNYIELQPLLPLLTTWFSRGLLKRHRLNTQDMEACLFGLRHIKCSDENTRRLIQVFSEQMKLSKHKINQSAVVHAFHLLRSADCSHPEIQFFVEALHDKIQMSNIKVKQRQGHIIYGLSYIQNPYPTIRPLIAMLPELLAPITDLSSRTGIGFLGGLRKLRCEYPETRDLLTRLLDDLENSKFKLHHMKDIGYSLRHAFYVFRNMTSVHKEVRTFLSFLTNEIEVLLILKPDGVAKLDASVVTDCLYCLRGMSSDHEEVQCVVQLLTQCASKCKDNYSHSDIAHALYGLKNMTSESSDIRSLLTLLTSKLVNCNQQMGLQDIGMAVVGLQSMSPDCDEVSACMQVLLGQVEGLKAEGAKGTDIERDVVGEVDLMQVLQMFKGDGSVDDELDALEDGLL
jgi:hypothetical protein